MFAVISSFAFHISRPDRIGCQFLNVGRKKVYSVFYLKVVAKCNSAIQLEENRTNCQYEGIKYEAWAIHTQNDD